MCLFYNLIANIRNAIKINKAYIIFSNNSVCLNFAKLLFFEGFILSVKKFKSSNFLKIKLKYNFQRTCCLKRLCTFRVKSTCFFVSYTQLTKLERKAGIFVVLTNKGLFTNQECLRNKVGGSILCFIE